MESSRRILLSQFHVSFFIITLLFFTLKAVRSGVKTVKFGRITTFFRMLINVFFIFMVAEFMIMQHH